MKRTKKSNLQVTTDCFQGLYEFIQPGAQIAIIDGPGQFPLPAHAAATGRVVRKEEDRWGKSIIIKIETAMDEARVGTEHAIHGLTKVGIGCYLLGMASA